MLEWIPLKNPSALDTRSAYDAIYQDAGICQLDSFYLHLLRRLKVRNGCRLLDVACGQGVLPVLASRQGVQAFAVDFSRQALQRASSRNPPFFTVADGEALPYRDGCFDYVTSIGSLEHYRSLTLGARELVRVMKPAGRALILLPNTFSLLHNVWTAFRTGRTGTDRQPIQRYAALREWQDFLEEAGLHVLHVFKYEKEFPRSFPDLVWYFLHPKELLRLMLTPLIPLPWACAFIFLCEKKKSKAVPSESCG